MKNIPRLKKDKVKPFTGGLLPNVTLPKEKHFKYIPFIREYFKLGDEFTVLKDYQIFKEPKGNWLIMKNNKIVMVLYKDYVKQLYEVDNG